MKIKVSVMMTTYNHERYIAEAVKSALVQKVDFPIEIVIGEDCSTDRTREILQDLQAANPGVIRLLAREVNWGRRKNFVDTLWACQGAYIAILEGDDYWISADKLQKQADLLDDHPEYALCFHPAIKRFEADGREVMFKPPAGRDRFALVDLLDRNFIVTCAVMFRSRLFPDLPPWFDHIPAGDWPLHVLNAQHGDIGYLPEMMGVHRIHAGGVWSPRQAVERIDAKIQILKVLRDHLEPEYQAQINRTLARLHLKTFWVQVRRKDFAGLRRGLAALQTDKSITNLTLAGAAVSALKDRQGSDD